MNAAVEFKNSQFFESVNKWYASATVRNSPRILVPESAKGEFTYPQSRQLLSEHPKIQALGQTGWPSCLPSRPTSTCTRSVCWKPVSSSIAAST